jgi:TetR/AcrR family transcriptional regulator, transcriptional repressor for nem operon
MSPRPANPEARDKLLDAAEGLMLHKGFAATGVEEICRGARLSKGSFFHYFRSKDDLAIAVIERYGAARLEWMKAAGYREKVDPRDRVFAYLEMMVAGASDPFVANGCLIGNLGQELSRAKPLVRHVIAERFEKWTDLLEADLAEAKRLYVPFAKWSPRTVARQIISLFEGSLILVKATGDPAVLRDNAAHFGSYLRVLLGDDSPAKRAPLATKRAATKKSPVNHATTNRTRRRRSE